MFNRSSPSFPDGTESVSKLLDENADLSRCSTAANASSACSGAIELCTRTAR
jgi:hypothetical protein